MVVIQFCSVFNLAALKVENKRLQGQVVNSPQRILREVADQKQALEQVQGSAEKRVKHAKLAVFMSGVRLTAFMLSFPHCFSRDFGC